MFACSPFSRLSANCRDTATPHICSASRSTDHLLYRWSFQFAFTGYSRIIAARWWRGGCDGDPVAICSTPTAATSAHDGKFPAYHRKVTCQKSTSQVHFAFGVEISVRVALGCRSCSCLAFCRNFACDEEACVLSQHPWFLSRFPGGSRARPYRSRLPSSRRHRPSPFSSASGCRRSQYRSIGRVFSTSTPFSAPNGHQLTGAVML